MTSSMDEAVGGEIRREGSLEPIQNYGSPNKRKERDGGTEDSFGVGGDKRARTLHGIEINEPRDNQDDNKVNEGKSTQGCMVDSIKLLEKLIKRNERSSSASVNLSLDTPPNYKDVYHMQNEMIENTKKKISLLKENETSSYASLNRTLDNLVDSKNGLQRQIELIEEMKKKIPLMKKKEGLLMNLVEVKNALPMPNVLAEKMQNDIFEKVEKMQNDLVEKVEKMQNELVEKVEKRKNELVEKVDKNQNDLVEKIRNDDLVEKIRNDLVEKIRNDVVEKIRNDVVEKIRNDLVEKIRNDVVEKIRNQLAEKMQNEQPRLNTDSTRSEKQEASEMSGI